MNEWKIFNERLEEDAYDNSWSITLNQQYPGWVTDSGYKGYGLPKSVAQWIVERLNDCNNKPECPMKMDEYGNWIDKDYKETECEDDE